MERLVKSFCIYEHCTSIYKGKKHTKETRERVRYHTSRHLEREGTTHEREGEAETSILMTHNSLDRIEVTDATLHEWRGWLKAFAYRNTVHQYKGKKHTKETRERVRSHEQTP